MPQTPRPNRIDLQEVADRNQTARRIVAGFSTTYPALTTYWQTLESALGDTHDLSAAHHRLKMAYADLQAAALATLSAHDDSEADPLFYLRDELHAQGIDRRRAW